MFSLLQMLGRSLSTIQIVDVGAMWLGQDHVAYRALLRPGVSRVIGFEPVPAECERLNSMKLPGHLYLPHFVGDGSERTFVLTNQSMTSSLYEPDLRLCSRFNHLAEVMQPVERSLVKTTRLDDITEVGKVDFLKVDVQGAEVDVFRGAARVLASTLVVQAEANFVPLYVGCPLFGDVDRSLREHGFEFHTFASIAGRAFRPITAGNDPFAPVKQVLWSDGVWVKSFMRFSEMEPEELLKLAAIVHEVYGSVDLAALALQHHDARVAGSGGGLWKAYMSRLLSGKAPPTPPPLD